MKGHMCRIGHEEIHYFSSGEDERCPLCQARDKIDALEAAARGIESHLCPKGCACCSEIRLDLDALRLALDGEGKA